MRFRDIGALLAKGKKTRGFLPVLSETWPILRDVTQELE